ncbi:MAG: SdpI family protein [Microbacterium sp.]|uniref:SdpI family protein n=1 Tax=Microbacterium sp. TaxID=51671 RepID=UPI00260D8FDB|nr:SdpI family protein [Microbacterium sp.]MCX6503499.1 SdpI family protein [Microbacterium sp.]
MDIAVSLLLFVVMAGAGMLLLWMARATASGRLKRNQFAGIRIPSTLASDEAWLAAHVRAKRPTEFAGWAAIATGLFALLPVPDPVLAAGVIAGCVVMLAFTLYGAWVGSRAATEVNGSPI